MTIAPSSNAFQAIRSLDYVIVRARDFAAMRAFYRDVLSFPVYREQFDGTWIEHRVGASLLVLTTRGFLAHEPLPPTGAAALQFAFRVTPSEVDACAEALRARDISLLSPPTDQPWGHRTLFFRDPDGNIVEIYADL